MFQVLLITLFVNWGKASLDLRYVPVEKRGLFVPPLEEVAQVLKKGLKLYFKDVDVRVADCPDLTQAPFGLAGIGLRGKTRLLSIGGVEFLMPSVNHSKVYDIRDVIRVAGLENAFVFGASAGPYVYLGTNGDSTYNINILGDKIDQQTRIFIVNKDGSYRMEKLPNNETRFDLLTDLFASEGEPGPLLKIHVHKRINTDSFGAAVRKTLAKHYGEQIVGLGGTFLLKEGTAWQTLLPDFPKTPLNDMEDIKRWFRHYNMSAPLVGVGTIVSGSLDLQLRLDHFHTFNEAGHGGHFNTDSTPEVVEYLGYFNLAEYVYRIDKPTWKVFRRND